MALHTLSLCSGIGGIELGTWIRRTYPYRVFCGGGRPMLPPFLRAKWRKVDLDSAPIWSDVRTFDGSFRFLGKRPRARQQRPRRRLQ